MDANLVDLERLPPCLKRQEVAALGRCCNRTIARAEARGELRAIRRGSGGSKLYSRTDVLRWLGLEVAQ